MTTPLPYRQSLDGCLAAAIGSNGLAPADLETWRPKLKPVMDALREDHRTGRLPLLRIVEDEADIREAETAFERLSAGAGTIVFFGTGGSSLGGETLAQLAGWSIPGGAGVYKRSHPRTRFYDNLDPLTLKGALDSLDLARTRFIVTSKSGGTAETLAQAIVALSAVKAAGLGERIPEMFLGITEPAMPGKANGLRALFESLEIPMLAHHTGIGGRFSCLTNVGLMPAISRGLDARAIRGGAREVVEAMLSSTTGEEFAPAMGALSAVALSKAKGIRTLVMMPYSDRLGKFAEWYVQLWAESLGKGGEGTSPIPALGPLDQHSQLQLFMDGPPELCITLMRVDETKQGAVIDPALAKIAGVGFMGGRTIGEVVGAQSHAVAEALIQAGRPVRTIDIPMLSERSLGALLMHFMLETIIAGRLLGLDPFDQPAVELAKTLTKERLSR